MKTPFKTRFPYCFDPIVNASITLMGLPDGVPLIISTDVVKNRNKANDAFILFFL